jgi:hypothetical protein
MRRGLGRICAAAFAVLLAANQAAILHARAAALQEPSSRDAPAPDESASVDGVPAWAFGTWCSSAGARPSTGWAIDRDHGAGMRVGGYTHQGTWSVAGVTPNGAELDVDGDLGPARLIFRRPHEDDPSHDVMYSSGMYYDRCGATDFDERS